MSDYSFPSRKNISSGNHFGRVLELIDKNKSDENSSPKNKFEIIILIEDQIYQLKIKKFPKIPEGAFVSFNIDTNFFVENIKIEQIPFYFNPNGDVTRWRRPSKNPSRMMLLRMRYELIYGIREWFFKKEFIETETPFLVKAPSLEPQISPFKTGSEFLISSPEFQMKRLLVGGFEKIFQVARCYRRDEIGSQHNPEFTMLEWYRSGEKLEVLINDIEQLVVYIIEKVKGKKFKHVPLPPWPRVRLRDLFKEHLGIVLDGQETVEKLIEKTKNSGNEEILKKMTKSSNYDSSHDYENIFYILWNEIEKNLPKSIPLFVYEWPSRLSSLARFFSENPGFVDRVELYVNSMEIANGYGELTNSVEQRLRFEENLKRRNSLGLDSLPTDEKFLTSLEHGLPNCSGMALGVDRLIMWLCNVNHIREVLCFSSDEI